MDKNLLSDLLAVIHRDGGHYESKHGTKKAVEDAIEIVIGLRRGVFPPIKLDKIFEKYYKEYLDECQGISMMAPSSSFGEGGIEGKFKEACKRMVFEIMLDYIKFPPIKDLSNTIDFNDGWD